VIPIRDANPTRRVPWVTLALIAANVAAFLLWEPTFASQAKQQAFFYCNAAIPWEISHETSLARGGAAARRAIDADLGSGAGVAIQSYLRRRCPDKSWLASIFVAMFLHGGWLHIGGNMLFLWIFGNNVEDRLGRLAFIVFYLLGGLAATALQVLFAPDSVIPNVGASGAIAAVLGAYLVLFPHARILTLVMFFFITWVELPALVVLGFWFVFQLISGLSELGALGRAVNSGVAYWAHVGGFVAGVVMTLLLFRGRRHPVAYEPLPPRPDLWDP
jgi:membrane associated rhomboid family serine protease